MSAPSRSLDLNGLSRRTLPSIWSRQDFRSFTTVFIRKTYGARILFKRFEIYSKRARYCVIFVSEEYNNRAWTLHERRSAQERMLKEKGQEYILPIKANAVDLPGLPTTIGYVSLKDLGIEKIAELLVKKLAK